MPQVEMRAWARPVEFRAAADGAGGVLAGYAAVYNRLSQNLGGFVERVDPGAFAKSLADDVPVLARYNHEALIGSTEAGTLRLASDGTGLAYEVDVPDTTTGRDVSVLARRGDLRYSSFAFETIADEWSVTEQGFPLRTLLSVRLIDVAPADSPAYRDTSVGIRSLSERIGRDATGMDPKDVAAALVPSAPVQQIEPRSGQVDNHPNRDYLAILIAMQSA